MFWHVVIGIVIGTFLTFLFTHREEDHTECKRELYRVKYETKHEDCCKEKLKLQECIRNIKDQLSIANAKLRDVKTKKEEDAQTTV